MARKKRLVSQVNLDQMLQDVLQVRPVDASKVKDIHNGIQRKLNDLLDEVHVAEQVTKGSPQFSQYYEQLFQQLNQISNSIAMGPTI